MHQPGKDDGIASITSFFNVLADWHRYSSLDKTKLVSDTQRHRENARPRVVVASVEQRGNST